MLQLPSISQLSPSTTTTITTTTTATATIAATATAPRTTSNVPLKRTAAALLSTLLVLCAATGARADVDDLTHITLDPYISNAGDKPVLLEFFAPWCSHCRHFESEYKQVGETLRGKAHVARVDGNMHRLLVMRFRVGSFPSFFLVHGGEVVSYAGARSHDGLVAFVRTLGEQGGGRRLVGGGSGGKASGSGSGSGGSGGGGVAGALASVNGPFGMYWRSVRAAVVVAEAARLKAEQYKDRPLALFGIVFGAVAGVIVFFAIVIYFVTKPKLPPSPSAARGQQRPHAE